MRVLGVDPGLHRTGVAIVDGQAGALHLVHAECLETAPTSSDPVRLSRLFDLLDEVVGAHQPDLAAVEKLFFATNRQSAMRVSEARGVALCVLARHRLAIAEYTPLQVKESVAGYGAAEKGQVARMTTTLLGNTPIEGPDDVTDACAIAICHHHRAPLAGSVSAGRRGVVPGRRSQSTPALAAAVHAAQRRLIDGGQP